MPTNSSTFSIPFSARVQRSATLGGKADARPWRRRDPCRAACRSFSLAVIETTMAPASAILRQDCATAQQFGPGHHYRLAALVQVVVAGDAVHGRRSAGDQRHVVGAREAGHRAVGHRAESVAHEAGDVRQDLVVKTPLDVGRIAAVDTDKGDRLHRPAVVDAVEMNGFHDGRRGRRGALCGRTSARNRARDTRRMAEACSKAAPLGRQRAFPRDRRASIAARVLVLSVDCLSVR